MAITNNLPAYVEQNHDQLLRKAIMGAESAKMFTLQTGVKTKSALNLLNTSVTFQDGSACGFSASGTSTLSQRLITAPVIKVNMDFCDKTLLNSALQHEVRVAAGQKSLPFEEQFISDVVDSVNLATDTMIWQGDKSSTNTNNVTKWTDGLIKILTADDGITVAAQNITQGENDTAKAKVEAVVMAIPTAVLNKAVIFMGYDTYRSYAMSMINANLYHYDGDGLDKGEVYFPGTNIRIKAVPGLDGTGAIVAANPANIFYGTDLQNDQEKFDFWYSKDQQKFLLAIEFGLGVQVAFPNECVISQPNTGD